MKKIICIFLFLTIFLRIQAADTHAYLREYVPTPAKLISHVATGFGGIAGFGASMTVLTPFVQDYGVPGIVLSVGASLPVSFVGAVFGAWTGKKLGQEAYPYISQLVQNSRFVATLYNGVEQGYKMAAYYGHHTCFLSDHLRRAYLQGTLFALEVPAEFPAPDDTHTQ